MLVNYLYFNFVPFNLSTKCSGRNNHMAEIQEICDPFQVRCGFAPTANELPKEREGLGKGSL